MVNRRRWNRSVLGSKCFRSGFAFPVPCCFHPCCKLSINFGSWSRKTVSKRFNITSGLSTEKAMATHSSILAWSIPWIEEPGRLQSMVSQESDTTWRLNREYQDACISLKECLCFLWMYIQK